MNFIIVRIILLLSLFIGCAKKEENKKSHYIQYNISFLLDLSDRIDPKLNPNQIEKDKEIILSVLNVIKKNVEKKGTFNSFDKFKIFFYPQPDQAQLPLLASNINFDLEVLEPKERKLLFQDIERKVSTNIDLLYSAAIKDQSYPGSDLWRFFKDEVNEKCIQHKENYKNILVILTDGYIYWKYTKNSIKNRYSYLLPSSNHIDIFRNDPNWISTFDKNDYGLIGIGQTFNDLKILVLEVNPTKNYPQDYDIIKRYFNKWFEEMGVNEENYKVLKTDIPLYSKPVIESFLTK